MEVEDFFPKYPNIYNNSENPPYMNPYNDISFEQAIYNKKEFNDLKVTKEDEKEFEDDALFKHQKAISRFLSSHTPYDGLFLFHEMGTGKTCAAFGSIENLRLTDNRYTGALVMTSNRNVLNNLIRELALVCTHKTYLPKELNIEKLSRKQLNLEIKKLTDPFYDFATVRVLASILEKMSDEAIITKYSNKIIVIDEVHNVKLYGRGDNKSSAVYNQLYRLLHLPKNCKKIIMSGTPMTDKASQIASVLNLILPDEPDKKFPYPDNFARDYLVKDENGIDILRLDKVDEFKKKIHGYVSYLKASLSDVKTTYVPGKMRTSPPLNYFTVFGAEMSKEQRKVYEGAFEKYKKLNPEEASDNEDEDEEKAVKKDIYRDAKESSI